MSSEQSTSSLQWGWLGCAFAALIGMGIFAGLRPVVGESMQIAFLLAETVLVSVVIAQACDPFADAAQWVGEEAHLPGSVRGATLDAVASSMPELFSGIFFVVVAVAASDDDQMSRAAAGAEGYGATVATCAGSAVYNMILIPAFCALFISYYRRDRPTIDVDEEVISRDGLWFVLCQSLLVMFLFQEAMQWWMAIVFLGLYAVYIYQLLYVDTKVYRRKVAALKAARQELGPQATDGQLCDHLRDQGMKVNVGWLQRAREKQESDGDDTPQSTDVLFGAFEVRLTTASATLVLVVATLVAALACYFLVEVTRDMAATLGVPTFFVAVIIAAAASSLPDTLLSVGAAMRGDDSGAVSNAFGSNIFDICVCMSIPLLVSSYLTGWAPVSLLADGKPIPGLVGLRVLLVVLTIVTLAIMWHNRQLTRRKAYVLCGLYAVFIGYAVIGSLRY